MTNLDLDAMERRIRSIPWTTNGEKILGEVALALVSRVRELEDDVARAKGMVDVRFPGKVNMDAPIHCITGALLSHIDALKERIIREANQRIFLYTLPGKNE